MTEKTVLTDEQCKKLVESAEKKISSADISALNLEKHTGLSRKRTAYLVDQNLITPGGQAFVTDIINERTRLWPSSAITSPDTLTLMDLDDMYRVGFIKKSEYDSVKSIFALNIILASREEVYRAVNLTEDETFALQQSYGLLGPKGKAFR